ncbi:MAG: hypothetical protein V3T31_06810, partial [candidate division Zixibacteria bacterium]
MNNRKNKYRFGLLFLLATLSLLLIASSCSHRQTIRPDEPYYSDADNNSIDEPRGRDPILAAQSVDRTFFVQAHQFFDLRRGFGTFWGTPRQAGNMNRFDEVPNNAWFTNRHAMNPMSADQIKDGVNTTTGPDVTGDWMVFRPKNQGATVGFWIEDKRGDQYIIKFDPEGNPEMATGAAAMASRYLHACGYNVPQETIVQMRPEWLKIKQGATMKENRRKRPFLQRDLDAIMSKVHKQPDGTIRVLASLSLAKYGKIKGPFSYDGRRADDPNDWCRHEDRRELRGLYVIASLINHYDTKDQNTLDVFVPTTNDMGYLKHYLIDFGSTFGSDGQGPKPPDKGYTNYIDLRDWFVSFITLGLKTWDWENHKPCPYPELGYFESEIFKPNKFDPIQPNPAFDNMTNRDAYWGAKIVMSWTDDDLRA